LRIGNYGFEPDHWKVREKQRLTAVMRLVNPRHREVQAATPAQQFPDRIQLGANENGFNFLHGYHRASASVGARFFVEWLSRFFVQRDALATYRMRELIK
jgi:hypothetical protein